MSLRRYFTTIITLMLCLLTFWQLGFGIGHPQAAKLNLIELKQRTDKTILVFTLKRNTTPEFFTLSDPERLVIDMPNTNPSSLLPTRITSNGLVKQIRLGYGPAGKGNIRLALDLAAKAEFVYLVDQNRKTNTQKITLILRPVATHTTVSIPKEPSSLEALAKMETDHGKVVHSPTITQAATTIASGANKEQQTTAASQRVQAKIKVMQANKVVVMIDPGHGGKDSGAIGPHRIMEKNVVLAISKKLQADLNQQPGITAKLTRKGDYFLPLRKRINIARANHADIFVAIHADAFKNDDAQGASVFALSQHGATSEAARWLADRENTSELSGISLEDKDRELKSVLLDMAQTATIQDSLKLGNSVLGQLKGFTPLHSNQVEQAAFVVLKSPDIPSILIETGFITNPQEEKLLSSSDYQAKIADAISQGIVDYFKRNPPPDTWFETQYKGP